MLGRAKPTILGVAPTLLQNFDRCADFEHFFLNRAMLWYMSAAFSFILQSGGNRLID